jgi:hypothetical protein
MRPFHPCGNKLLFPFSKKVIVTVLVIIKLFLFFSSFLKYLNLLFITTYLFFLKHRLNPVQCGFRKFISTSASLATYLNCIPSVRTQGQIYSVYCSVLVGSIHDGTLLHSKFNTQLLITVSNSSITRTTSTGSPITTN